MIKKWYIAAALSLAGLAAGCGTVAIPEHSQTHSIYTPKTQVEIPATILKQQKMIQGQENIIEDINRSLEDQNLSGEERTKIEETLLRKKLILQSMEFQLKLDEDKEGINTP